MAALPAERMQRLGGLTGDHKHKAGMQAHGGECPDTTNNAKPCIPASLAWTKKTRAGVSTKTKRLKGIGTLGSRAWIPPNQKDTASSIGLNWASAVQTITWAKE